MDRNLLGYFWSCGDDDIIRFAIQKAHLNRKEYEVIHYLLDDCRTQEETAELIGYSVRRTQAFWYSGADKLLRIPWVKAYAEYIKSL